MKSSSPRHAAARPRALTRRASTLAALGLAALAIGPVAAAQAGPVSIWNGGTVSGTTQQSEWSDAANWDTLPSSGSALEFPTLTQPCGPNGASCDNDLTAGTNFSGLTIDTGSQYQLTGNAFGLGSGGITATSLTTNAPSSSIGNDIALTAPQTWSVSGGGMLTLDGQITGTDTLGVNLADGSALSFGGNADVGPVTLTGHDSSQTGSNATLNGSLTVNQDLNGTSGGAINATDIEIDPQPTSARCRRSARRTRSCGPRERCRERSPARRRTRSSRSSHGVTRTPAPRAVSTTTTRLAPSQ